MVGEQPGREPGEAEAGHFANVEGDDDDDGKGLSSSQAQEGLQPQRQLKHHEDGDVDLTPVQAETQSDLDPGISTASKSPSLRASSTAHSLQRIETKTPDDDSPTSRDGVNHGHTLSDPPSVAHVTSSSSVSAPAPDQISSIPDDPLSSTTMPLSVQPPREPRSPKDDRDESSPDESTAIVWRERGGGRRTYGGGDSGNGTDPHADGQIDADAVPASGEPAVDGSADAVHDADSWWRRLVDKYGSIELENKASVARDHLALERTFLAWLRTSLAFASIGIAVTQLFRLNTTIAPPPPATPSPSPSAPGSTPAPAPAPSSTDGSADSANPLQLRHVGKPLGATFLAIAVVVLFVGFHRYFESQHWIIRGKFPASRGSVFLITIVAAALIVVSLVVVVTVDTNAYRN